MPPKFGAHSALALEWEKWGIPIRDPAIPRVLAAWYNGITEANTDETCRRMPVSGG